MADYDLVIIGAGIAGSSLAAMCSPHCRIALIDRDISGIPGSTGHAPGVVAQINSVAALTELARRSVSYYRRIPGGFDVVGGLEVALGPRETRASLEARAALAKSRGLEAEVLSRRQAQALAPAFVRDEAAGAVHFPNDGLCNAKGVARANHDKARQNGATLVDGDATSLQGTDGVWYITVSLQDGGEREITGTHVAVCTGAWAGQLLPNLDAAAVAVAHPYAFSSVREPRPPPPQVDLLRKPGTVQPFVRFPGQTVYARDHGTRDGLGSYAHPPAHVPAGRLRELGSGVAGWDTSFDLYMDSGATVLPDETAQRFNGPRVILAPGTKAEGWKVMDNHDVAHAFTGLMTMTPDGVPLCGKIQDCLGPATPTGAGGGPKGKGGALWCLVGTWVTHAAGCAGTLAQQILHAMGKNGLSIDDAWLRAALDPHRFDYMPETERRGHCLDKYADIWNRKDQCMATARPRAKM